MKASAPMPIDTASTFRALAQTCRQLAKSSTTPGAADSLNEIAKNYLEQAHRADAAEETDAVASSKSGAKKKK